MKEDNICLLQQFLQIHYVFIDILSSLRYS